MELWQEARYEAIEIRGPFIQDNLSHSRRGVLRGLHLHGPNAQGKLVVVPYGEVFDVAVDVRRGSPTFGLWTGTVLSGMNHRQLWIPPGFAHGFAVLSEWAVNLVPTDIKDRVLPTAISLDGDPTASLELAFEVAPLFGLKATRCESHSRHIVRMFHQLMGQPVSRASSVKGVSRGSSRPAHGGSRSAAASRSLPLLRWFERLSGERSTVANRRRAYLMSFFALASAPRVRALLSGACAWARRVGQSSGGVPASSICPKRW